MTKTVPQIALPSSCRAGSFSSQGESMRNVTMSSVISRMERAAARKAAKAKSLG